MGTKNIRSGQNIWRWIAKDEPPPPLSANMDSTWVAKLLEEGMHGVELAKALDKAFDWESTTQGTDYWRGVHANIAGNDGRLSLKHRHMIVKMRTLAILLNTLGEYRQWTGS